MIEKKGVQKCENKLLKKLKISEIEKKIENYEFDKVLNEIFSFVDVCNEYVQANEIWISGDRKKLYELADSIKAIAILLWPFIPSTSEKIAKQFKFDIIYKNIIKPLNAENFKNFKKSEILFRKI